MTTLLNRRVDETKVAGWQVLVAFLLLFAAFFALQIVWGVAVTMGGKAIGLSDALRMTISRIGSVVLLTGMVELVSRRVTGRTIWQLSFNGVRVWWQDLVVGLGLGALGMTALFVLYTAAGWLTVEGNAFTAQPISEWLSSLWVALVINAAVAFSEELLFRGFFQTALSEAWGKWLGLIGMAIPFAALHYLVSTASEVSFGWFMLGLLAPSLMLGWVYIRTGSLWLPMGLHFAWNMLQGEVLNLVADTAPDRVVGLFTQFDAPGWLAGTAYGIETGLLVLLPVGLVVLGVWLWTRSTPARA